MILSRLGVACAGLLMGAAQVLLVRRALALAGGDEAVFALTLTLWLIIVAAGSALGSLLAGRTAHPAGIFATGLSLLFPAVAASVYLLPYAASRLGWIPGTVPGSGALAPALVLALLPVGLIGGALFPLACKMLAASSQRPVHHAYLAESAGSFLAGTGLSLIFFLPLPKSTEITLASRFHPGMQVLDLIQTPYGILEVTRQAGQTAVYENGLLLAISDDPAAAEERAFLTLAQYPYPRRVLWIGGLLGGALPEALRDPAVERLDLVEINPGLQQVIRWFDQDASALRESRVSFHLEDGRRFLAQSPPGSYDLIALNLPGPRSARLAKYYSVEGFRLARRALKPGGVLTFMVESSEDYVGKDLGLLLASLRKTLAEVFPQVVVLPGGNAVFAAGDSTAKLAQDAATVVARLTQAGIQPQYWDQYRLEDRLSGTRVNRLRETLDAVRNTPVNRDAAPVSFYFNQVVWSRQSRGGWAGLLKAVRGSFAWVGIGLVLTAVAGAMFLRRWYGKREKLGAASAVTTVGMTGLSLEILALVAYQVRFGSGYREVGLLLGLYMAGLALGAAAALRLHGHAWRFFPIVQTHWILAAGSLIPLLAWGSLLGKALVLYQGLFALYLLVLGILGGAHFPLALEFAGLSSERDAGRFYALDLAGAAVGALMIGLIALPLAGITACAMALAVLNAAPLLLLLKPASPTPA